MFFIIYFDLIYITDDLLSNQAFRNIIEQCVQESLAKKLDEINDRLDLLDSKVIDLEQRTDKY